MNKKEKEQTNRLLLACQITKFTMIELSLPKMPKFVETQRLQKNNQRKACKNKISQKKIPTECTKTISRKKEHIKKARKSIKHPYTLRHFETKVAFYTE